jgi:NAD-dependent SIR2 family protein deacetylase
LRIVKCPYCKKKYEQYNNIHKSTKIVPMCEDCKYERIRSYQRKKAELKGVKPRKFKKGVNIDV